MTTAADHHHHHEDDNDYDDDQEERPWISEEQLQSLYEVLQTLVQQPAYARFPGGELMHHHVVTDSMLVVGHDGDDDDDDAAGVGVELEVEVDAVMLVTDEEEDEHQDFDEELVDDGDTLLGGALDGIGSRMSAIQLI